MCGVAGVWSWLPTAVSVDSLAEAMAARLVHRGPDGHGVWSDADAGIALAHRRLAVIDLSERGHQPMHSADRRYVLSYNGEVYNFRELRGELEAKGHRFDSQSDTEVVLAAVVEWGIEAALPRLWGMFALALWDRQERTLHLARDRFGVKPLYWYLHRNLFLFGSEVRALEAHPDFDREIDPEAVAALVRYSYVPAPCSIYVHARKLTPGCILTLRQGDTPRIEPYWSLAAALDRTGRRPPNAQDAVDHLQSLATDAVQRRMISDVPLGAFLSGGVDSSLVVALMQAASTRKVRTFTIGFENADFDESGDARAVAQHLGTDHTELRFEERHALEIVPKLPDIFDEPFADSSQIPTYLVSEMTRRHVTVALSGDGGDETFGGYPRYQLAGGVFRRLAPVPRPLRALAGATLRTLPSGGVRALARLIPASRRPPRLAERIHRLGALLDLPADDALHDRLSAGWTEERTLVPASRGALRHMPDPALAERLPDLVARMQYYDTLRYLPDDIMTKVDRCSMAVSLEAREPLLDHRLVEFVWSLPQDFKLHGSTSKWILRQVLDRFVPRALVNRPKKGFSVPLDAWLRGPLRDWAETLLNPDDLAAEGMFDAVAVRGLWNTHVDGRTDRGRVLWNVLMMRAWSTARPAPCQPAAMPAYAANQ